VSGAERARPRRGEDPERKYRHTRLLLNAHTGCVASAPHHGPIKHRRTHDSRAQDTHEERQRERGPDLCARCVRCHSSRSGRACLSPLPGYTYLLNELDSGPGARGPEPRESRPIYRLDGCRYARPRSLRVKIRRADAVPPPPLSHSLSLSLSPRSSITLQLYALYMRGLLCFAAIFIVARRPTKVPPPLSFPPSPYRAPTSSAHCARRVRYFNYFL
jgi:hypothetical protein